MQNRPTDRPANRSYDRSIERRDAFFLLYVLKNYSVKLHSHGKKHDKYESVSSPNKTDYNNNNTTQLRLSVLQWFGARFSHLFRIHSNWAKIEMSGFFFLLLLLMLLWLLSAV